MNEEQEEAALAERRGRAFAGHFGAHYVGFRANLDGTLTLLVRAPSDQVAKTIIHAVAGGFDIDRECGT